MSFMLSIGMSQGMIYELSEPAECYRAEITGGRESIGRYKSYYATVRLRDYGETEISVPYQDYRDIHRGREKKICEWAAPEGIKWVSLRE